jgi:beta-lactamase class A
MEARVALLLFALGAARPGHAAAAPEAKAPPSPPAREAALLHKLELRLAEADRRLDGLLGISVKDLTTGATLEMRPDETFPTASSIKAAVLYELYLQAEAGRIDLSEVTRPPGARVKGGGALEILSDRVSLTWRDLAALMFAYSDNEATNVLTRKLGLAAVNQRLDAVGLPKTRMRRLMMDLEAARRGDENVSTPGELRRLLEIVYAGKGLSAERVQDLRAVATLPKDSPFRAPLPEGLAVADKPGWLEGVRCVGAVVDLPGRPYSAAIMTSYLKKDAEGDAVIREISALLYETFSRLARSSDLGRVISER